MQTIKFVTSFSKEGYAVYGKTFLESAIKHLPKSAEIVVYYEGENPSDITDDRLVYKNLYDIPGVKEWLMSAGFFSMMRGVSHGQRNYRYDAFRFTRKIFAQCDAASGYDGLLFWIDADTVFKDDIGESFFREILEDDFIAYMDRPSWHLCASFVGWNTRHDQNVMFWTRLWDLMFSGDFLILPEWHDSYILAMMIDGLDLKANDIAKDIKLEDGPVNVFNYVFKGRAEHKKGNLKYGPQRYSQLIDIVRDTKPDSVIEIGTWNGDRAIQMAEAASPIEMAYIGFDLFETATDETDEAEKNVKPHFTADDVANKLAGYGITSHLVKGNTNVSFPGWIKDHPDVKVPLIYIDGGHAVETIKNDFHNALQCIQPGGLIVFDDYYEQMPEDELDKFGCNRVLEESGYDFEVLPIADPVKGGGVTKMAVVRIEEQH